MRLQSADVVVTDPEAVDNARRWWPDLQFVETAEEALAGADVVLLATEWTQFTTLDPVAVGELVRAKTVLDGRNALDADAWRAAGWTYRALGRGRQ